MAIQPEPPPSPPMKAPAESHLRRVAKRVLRSAALMYLIICIVMFAFQSYLIFPGTFRQGAEETRFDAGPNEELVHLKTPDGTPLVGFFGKADGLAPGDTAPRPTAFFFYGNGDNMKSAFEEFHMFRRLGYHCMLVDYAGYGMSGGKASEQGCYAAAEAAYQYVLTRPDV